VAADGPFLLRKPATEAALHWRFAPVETDVRPRSAQLAFIFRPLSWVPVSGEPDYAAPYQMSVSWTGIVNSAVVADAQPAHPAVVEKLEDGNGGVSVAVPFHQKFDGTEFQKGQLDRTQKRICLSISIPMSLTMRSISFRGTYCLGRIRVAVATCSRLA